MKQKKVKQLLLLGIAVLFNLLTQAQTQSMLNASSVTVGQLDSGQLARYSRLSASTLNDSFQLVEIQNLSTHEVNGKIKISFAGFSCADMIFTRINSSYTSESDYYWYGFIDDTSDLSCKSGSITLMARQGEKFGTVIFDDYSYDLQELGSGVQLLSRTKLELFGEDDCAVDSNTITYRPVRGKQPKEKTGRILPCQPDCEVRVLVLWTQAAQNLEGNINNRIALAMAQTNQAYRNSLINEATVRLTLAGSQLVNFVESTAMDIDVAALAGNPAIQALRANAQADLVVLLTDGDYPATEGIVNAIGPNFATSYSIVQTNAATTGRFAFAHEVGHLFGAKHNDHAVGTIEHGHRFGTGFLGLRRRYTIVTSTPGGKNREHLYSTPLVEIKNKPAGTADYNDNAQWHRDNVCTVSDFFANPMPPASVNIMAFQQDCYVGYAEAIVQCGTAPYTYSWEMSLDDGNNYQPIGSNSDIINFYFFCQSNTFLNLRVTVVDAASVSRVAYFHLELDPNYPLKIVPKEQPDPKTQAPIIQRLYPNPASGSIQADLLLPAAENTSVVVLDVFGQIYKPIFSGLISRGQRSFTINTSTMEPGIYKLRVTTRERIEYKQFIIIK